MPEKDCCRLLEFRERFSHVIPSIQTADSVLRRISSLWKPVMAKLASKWTPNTDP